MSSQESNNASQSTVRSEEDTFNILVATDIHLGYAEDDPIRGPDTFDTFEEILQIAKTEQVDFILLGGDLFHNTQPSPYCLNKCIELIKHYCFGDRPVAIEFLSDPRLNFTQSVNPVVNYEDPNLNISLPIFSIHGNHDDPTGKNHTSAMDLLSTSGLVNYFGRWNSFEKVEITPILLKKSSSKLALYGLSHIRDERLGRLFIDDKVKMSHPQNKEEWFHLLVWHQNRATRGSKNFIPDNCLPSFLDLVIWGHEHDCRIEPERKKNDVFISQPGSSVATSLIEGESITKKVGLLKINKNDFKMIPIELKTVRPFIYAEMAIKNDPVDENYSSSDYMKDMVTKKVDMMIREAKGLGHTAKVSEKPLIRLIIRYKSDRNVFNTIRFGQSYFDKVANSDNMVKFQMIKTCVRRDKGQDIKDEDGDDDEPKGPTLAERVEDLVTEKLSGKKKLKLFPLSILNEAVKKTVDANDCNAIRDVTENFIKEVLNELTKVMPEIEETENCIQTIKQKMEENSRSFVEKICDVPRRQRNQVIDDNDDDNAVLLDNDDNGVGKTKKPAARGRGSTRARRGRGSASTSKINNDDDDDSFIDDDSDDQASIFRNKKATGMVSRGRRGRGKK